MKAIGDVPVALSTETARALTAKLSDPAPRVRFFAALALANRAVTLPPAVVVNFVRDQMGQDEFLRHAAVMLLASRAGDGAIAAAAAADDSTGERLAALLAMRRLARPEIAQFLTDKEPLLVSEAARAINDEGIAAAYPALAKVIENPTADEQLMLRVINANYRSGDAVALGTYAADGTNAEALRIEALHALATWPKPPARDRIAGVFRPLAARDAAPAIAAVQSALPQLLAAKSQTVPVAAIDAVNTLAMRDQSPALFALLSKPEVSPKARGRALETLAALNDPKLADAIKLALTDKDPGLRVVASAMLGKLDPDEAAAQLAAAFGDAAIAEKKPPSPRSPGIKSAAADKSLATLLDDLAAGKSPPKCSSN